MTTITIEINNEHLERLLSKLARSTGMSFDKLFEEALRDTIHKAHRRMKLAEELATLQISIKEPDGIQVSMTQSNRT